MLLYTILYYFASSNLSVAAPPSISGSQFANGMMSSVSPRDTDMVDMCPRTRLEIIWTCLATIFAASWVAVHPNMPGPNASKVEKTLLRILVMICTIIMPEFILLWAMQQWRGAKNMEQEFISRFRKPNDAFKWTKKHGFFLHMGGFVLHGKDRPRRILEWDDLMEYYENGRVDLSEITEATIDGRSKVDGFGKCIALIQTSWFIIQCIARFSDKNLALTELELDTAALAVLSLLMYCFWWNKPFNAEVPIAIILLDPVQEIRSHPDLSIQIDGDVLPIHIKAVSKFRASTLAGIDFVRSKLLNWNSFKKLALILFNACGHALVSIGELANAYPSPVDPDSMDVPAFYYSVRVTTSRGNHITLNQIGSYLIAALFGAIHCAGWSDKMIFHTRTVSLLWRISSVITTGSPLLWISFLIFASVEDAAEQGSTVLAKVTGVLLSSTSHLSVFSIPLYIIARIILLILAFVELRHIPPGALNNIPWANVLPFIH